MTGTFQPSANSIRLSRVNVAERIEDYKKGFRFHLGLVRRGVFDRLLFVENSGYGMQDFEPLVNSYALQDKVQLLSYKEEENDTPTTRFFGECRLLKYALDKGDWWRNAEPAFVWKVTGRYIVRNIEKIIKGVPGTATLVLHCRNRPMEYVDFGLAGFREDIGRRFLSLALARPEVSTSDERLIRIMMKEGRFGDIELAPRFPEIPDFSGIRGSDNARYDGVNYRLKFVCRRLANRIFPRLWI